MSGVRTFKDGGDARAETEPEEDTDSNLSLDEIEKTEDSFTSEATSELKEDIEISAISEKISSDDERVFVSDLKEEKDRDFESKDKIEEAETDTKSEIKHLLTTIQDIIPLTLSITEQNGKENINDEIPITKEDTESKSEIATPHKKIKKVSESVKEDDKSQIRLPASKSKQMVKDDKTKSKDIEIDKTRIKDIEKDKIKRKKSDMSLTPEKYIAKNVSSERLMKKKKKPERLKTPSPGERKRVLDKSEEKVALSYSQRRSRKLTDGDSEKQKRDGESQKRSPRREEDQRKQLVPKSKFKTDKKATTSPKTGDIDVSKTQSKYMAWYNKKREEMEKKRLEKKVDDEEQLPRWVSRSLRQTTKQREKLTMERKSPEITPRTKRKVKPLVNVESEQLKAIVRQGRQMRKAEGNLKEDPPIQIYARTPPVSTADAQHRLQQHSEYKYERIPPPFYLHPPPAPHPSPQLSPERSLEIQPCGSQYEQSEDDLHPENAALFQSGGRLRHQQLLEKKSVFDIAYSEAAPSQLRSDSATPPS